MAFYLFLAVIADISILTVTNFLHLKENIKSIDKTNTAEGFHETIKSCVDYHNEILDNVADLEYIMQYPFLGQFLITGITLCGLAFQIITVIYVFFFNYS